MNRSSFALLIALLIHFIFLLLYLRMEKLKPSLTKNKIEKKIKVSLRELVKPKPIQKNISSKIEKKVPPPKEMPVMPKGSQIKKIPKKVLVKYTPTVVEKKVKLNFKTIEQPLILKNTKIKKTILQDKQEESGMNWLYTDRSNEIIQENTTHTSSGTSLGKDLLQLYGDEFGKLSTAQQNYILDNQEIMKRITQGVLNRQASVSNLIGINANKSNIIEFYLHPDGSMSEFKFLEKSGYFMLDEITRVTMEYAYAKYPRPSEKTLIRYNVFYNLRY